MHVFDFFKTAEKLVKEQASVKMDLELAVSKNIYVFLMKFCLIIRIFFMFRLMKFKVHCTVIS